MKQLMYLTESQVKELGFPTEEKKIGFMSFCYPKSQEDICCDILEKLTWDEQNMLAFAPLIILSIAMEYGKRCRKYASDHKISFLRCISRMFDDLEKEFEDYMSLDLDYTSKKRLLDGTRQFEEENGLDFMKMFFVTNNEFLKNMSNYPHSTMRSEALCGVLMIDMYREFYKIYVGKAEEKLGYKMNFGEIPIAKRIEHVLLGYAGADGKFNRDDKLVKRAYEVIMRRLEATKWEKVD